MTYSRFESHLIENREVRIFLSSTFSDMDKERTALVRLFHKLKLEANKRCASLSLIDLRWGITADESRTGKVLSVCLNEIENSHPFFIGLLGNRYGYTPEASELEMNPELMERYPWIGKDIAHGMSITEIEMLYGALRNQEDLDAAFFIKDYNGMPPDDNGRLTALKTKIREQKRFPVFGFDSIDRLCYQVEKTVMGILDKYFSGRNNTRLGRERNIQQAYINSRHRFYVPQQEDLERLDSFLAGDERYLVVTGNSGIGKSALIANWLKHLDRKPDTGYNFICHFVGNHLGGNGYHEVLQHISDEIFELYDGMEVKTGYYDENPEEKAQRYMTEAVQKGDRPMLIVIDGINQIDDHDQTKLLNWLPQSAQKVKYLFSTVQDDETMETFIRRGYPRYTVKSLQRREEFIRDYLALVGKKLDKGQTERILNSKITENTLVMKTLLDELICFGSHNKLDQRINFYLTANSIPDFFTKMLQRLEDDYECAKEVLSLIAVSEHGLSEEELVMMTDARQMDFYLFFCAVSSHMTSCGGQLVFSHQYITDAVWSSYDLTHPTASKPYREKIIRYFSREDTAKDKRQMTELAFQYYHINDNENLYKSILSFEAFEYYCASATGCTLLASYWKRLRHAKEGKYQLRDYLDLPYEDIPLKNLPYLSIGHFFHIYLADTDTALMYAKTYLMMALLYGDSYSLIVATCYNDIGSIYLSKGDYEQAQIHLEEALRIKETHPCTEEAIAPTYNNIGLLYENIGDYDRAIEYLRRATDICVNVHGSDNPRTAMSIDNLGLAYQKKEDYDQSLRCHQKAIRIFENILGVEHPHTASSYNNAGLVFEALEKYDTAKRYHQRALAIRTKTLGPEHPDTSYSLCNIGRVYHRLKDYQQALEYSFKALEIQTKTLSPKHPCVATTYGLIGRAYDYMGERYYHQALDYYQKALAIREEILGEHPDTATTYYDIACVYGFQGNDDMALKYHLKALAIREKKLRKNHPDLGRSLNNIGYIYSLRGELKQALFYFLRAVAILEESLTPAHEDVITSYYNIADAYTRMGELDAAAECFRKAAEQRDEESQNALEILKLIRLKNL